MKPDFYTMKRGLLLCYGMKWRQIKHEAIEQCTIRTHKHKFLRPQTVIKVSWLHGILFPIPILSFLRCFIMPCLLFSLKNIDSFIIYFWDRMIEISDFLGSFSTAVRAGPEWNQELGAQSRYSLWKAGTQSSSRPLWPAGRHISMKFKVVKVRLNPRHYRMGCKHLMPVPTAPSWQGITVGKWKRELNIKGL